MDQGEQVLFVEVGGPRTPFHELARLFADEVDLDSDGNSAHWDDSDWAELSLVDRAGVHGEFHIDPVQDAPLVLMVRGCPTDLAERAAPYLVDTTGGRLVADPRG